MKNRKIVSILIVLLLAFSMLTACAPDPIQTDLKSYINNQFPAVQTLLVQASTAYNGVAGDNYTDDATMLAALTDTILPAASGALEAAQKLAPETKEVADVNDQLITALTSYVNGYTSLAEALTNGDAAKADEAQTFLTSAQTEQSDFMTALTTLATDHGLKINTK